MGYTPIIALLCTAGVALSLYAIYIERSKHADVEYQATCDLDETIACSYVLTSDYSTGLGLIELLLGQDHFLNIPNSYGGLLLYPVLLVLGTSHSRAILLLAVILSLLACLMSVYLIYILVFVLQKICLVCMGVHCVNVVLFILFTLKWRSQYHMDAKKVH